jgi:glutamate carboxypeptidase
VNRDVTTPGVAPRELLSRLEQRADRILACLRAVVEAESESGDGNGLRRCSDVLAEIVEELLGRPAIRDELGGLPCLRLEGDGKPFIGIIGHFDTVHPAGTLAVNPFRVEDGWVYGPGIMDMKGGIVQALAALAVVGVEGVTILLTPDEELGSKASRPAIEALARSVEVVLVPEPPFDGALKLARKGSVTFDIDVIGREAHAGLEPEDGINATVAMAHVAIAAAALGDAELGTTVTPTTASSGAAGNIVPGRARLHVDIRAWTPLELARVENALRDLEPSVPGAEIVVGKSTERAPLEERQSRPLFELAQRAAREAGLDEPRGAAVGGGSDGSLTAAVGTPTLDGLGAVGTGAHTPVERIREAEILPRSALFAAIVQELRALERSGGSSALRP